MTQRLRCAVYTRKSTEEGLDQDFNSLHAQRESCVAYIVSQKHEGWQLNKTNYDDGGFSGGNMERPALKTLLADIAENRIDVIVVYKVDRLSRSLHDFAKMVEIFDKHKVSFVSVTQSFNTTSSMGRLTLNVLLSFAQFEREVTGERIRDKIAASKKKGIWMGGSVPLGYKAKDRKLIIDKERAKIVIDFYTRYAELGCIRLLKEELDKDSNNFYSRGALHHILTNPIYIGQIRHKNVCHKGLHESIIEKGLWDKVQTTLAGNRIGKKSATRKTEPSPLAGKLFDSTGERLSPVHTKKNGRRYRYYVSQSLLNNTREQNLNGWRLPAIEIEDIVVHSTSKILNDQNAIAEALEGLPAHSLLAAIKSAKNIPTDPKNLISKFVERVEVQQASLRLIVFLTSVVPLESGFKPEAITRDIQIKMKRRGVEMRLIVGGNTVDRSDPALIKAIGRGHKWFNELACGTMRSIQEIAERDGFNKTYVNRIIHLGFLAPRLVEKFLTGMPDYDTNIERLTKEVNLSLNWRKQVQQCANEQVSELHRGS